LKSPKHKPWSPADEQTLRDMAKAGTSVMRISGRLRRSVMAVKARALMLGVKIVSMTERRKVIKKKSSHIN
jgi:hypothetical protein